MGRLLRRRALFTIPTLILVTLIVFGLRLVIPGGPAAALAGSNGTPEVIARLEHELGVDKPLPVQYWDWITRLFRGDLGTSTATHQPVAQILADRLPPTMELVGGAILLSLLFGGAAGIWAAIRRYRRDGRAVFAASGFALSLPRFWVAAIAVGLFGLSLGWVPAVGFTSPSSSIAANLRGLALPVLVLAGTTGALICRHLRSSMATALESVHVRTAWSVGLSPWRVYVGDALRTSLGPVITFLPLAVAELVGAAVVVENVINIPGLGTAIVQAVDNRDYPTLQGIVLFMAVLVIVLNLVSDLLLAMTDPRVRRAAA